MALDRHARHEHCLTNVNNISVLNSASQSPLPPGQTQTRQDDNLKTDLRQNKFSKLCPVLWNGQKYNGPVYTGYMAVETVCC